MQNLETQQTEHVIWGYIGTPSRIGYPLGGVDSGERKMGEACIFLEQACRMLTFEARV